MNKEEKLEYRFAAVPQGDPIEWNNFYAPNCEFVWDDGLIGHLNFKRKPSETEKTILLQNIEIALGQVNEYRQELERARAILTENPSI